MQSSITDYASMQLPELYTVCKQHIRKSLHKEVNIEKHLSCLGSYPS